MNKFFTTLIGFTLFWFGANAAPVSISNGGNADITVWATQVPGAGYICLLTTNLSAGQTLSGVDPTCAGVPYQIRWCCYNGGYINQGNPAGIINGNSMGALLTIPSCFPNPTTGDVPDASDGDNGPCSNPNAGCSSCSGSSSSSSSGHNGSGAQVLSSGMPTWNVSEPFLSLWLQDEPLGYQPAQGPRVSFRLSFKQRESASGFNTNFFSVGKKWNFSWFSFVSIDASGNTVVHFSDGRLSTLSGTKDVQTDANISGNTNSGFTLLYPDGSQDVYSFVVTNAAGAFLEAFLTQRKNPNSQGLTFQYNGYVPSAPAIQLRYVIDGDGRTNFVYYSTTNAYSTNLISEVVDAFGRSNFLFYDNSGHLTNMIDVQGMASLLTYDTNDWVTGMQTPYGATTFRISDTVPNGRSILIGRPDGGNELYLYTNNAPGIPGYFSDLPNTAPFSNTFDNSNMGNHNTFYWGPRQYANLSATNLTSFTTNDFMKARMRHWLQSTNIAIPGTIVPVLSMERNPSLDSGGFVEGQKTWYDYAGKTNAQYEGADYSPLFVARVLPDTSTMFQRTDRNAIGNVLTNISTYTSNTIIALRTNINYYDSIAGIDLITSWNSLGVRTSSNSYNAYHQVISKFDAINQLTQYTYNSDHQLTSTTLPTLLIITNIFSVDGLLITNYSYTSAGAFFGTNSYSYSNDLVNVHVNELGLRTSNTWDNLQRLLRVSYPDGTFAANYYSNLDLVQTVDRMGFTNFFVYDSERRMIAKTNALGNYTLYDYCTCGSLNAIHDALGNITQYFYNNEGWLTNTVLPDGTRITNYYSRLRQLTNSIDSAGRSATNWFNNQGLRYAVSNAVGQVSKVAFDSEDRMINSVDANGVSVASTYDDLGRLTGRSYPDTGTEFFGYDATGLRFYTNQLNHVTLYGYDAAQRKVAETNANAEITSYTYDAGGDLLTLIDGKSQTTTWQYDEFGRVTNKLDAASTRILSYQYDADNRLTNRWSAAKNNTGYAYDAVGNLTHITYPVSPAISLSYDALNRLAGMVDGVGTTVYGYDAAGQVLSEDGPWANDTVGYTYNDRLRSSMSLQEPNGTAWIQTYAYDPARRLTNTTSAAGSFTYAYDSICKMEVAKLSLPNGAYITNDYDSVARLLHTWMKNSGNTNLDSYSYAYNVGNQRYLQTFTTGNYDAYTYDPVGQLTAASGKEPGGTTNRLLEQFGYGYDAAHNLHLRTNNNFVQTFNVTALNELTNVVHSNALTVSGTTGARAISVTVSGTGLTTGGSILYGDQTWAATNQATLADGANTYTAIAHDSLGRYSTNTIAAYFPSNAAYAYDLNGNLLSDGLRNFAYDDENELIAVWVTNVWQSTFVYDGKMRRRIRREYSWQYGAWLQTNEIRYVYDGNLVVQERDQNNLPVITYSRGTDLSHTLQGAGGIGGLLALSSSSPVNLGHYYYHADGNGNVTMLINTLQLVAAKYAYDPFGNLMSLAGSMANINLYRFSSKEWNSNSGLYYYLYRFYDPNTQRWVNRDPILETTLSNLPVPLLKKLSSLTSENNLYRFDDNDPLNEMDPDGRFAIALPILAIPPVAIGVGIGVAVCLAIPSCRAALAAAIQQTGRKAVCMAGLLACLNNPWVAPTCPTGKFQRKDCRSCYNECLNDGSWPYYKCP